MSESHLIDLDSIENNSGIFAFRTNDIKVDHRNTTVLVSTITLGCRVDLQEVKDGLYSAELNDDGTAVIIKRPAVEAPFLDFANMGYHSEYRSSQACELTETAHQAAVSRFRKKNEKKVVYEFPDGITCSTKYFSSNRNSGQLKPIFDFIESSVEAPDKYGGHGATKIVNQVQCFIRWKVAIQGTEVVIDEADEVDEDNIAWNSIYEGAVN